MMSLNPILVAAAADFLVGWLWYSDLAFGAAWRKASGHSKVDMKKDFYLRIAVQILASIMIATALYIAILTFQRAQVPGSQAMFTQLYSWFFIPVAQNAEMMASLKIAGFVWFGFYVPAGLSCTVWHSAILWQKFILKAGGRLAQLLAMAAVLATLG
jgi:hypothetical protein